MPPTPPPSHPLPALKKPILNRVKESIENYKYKLTVNYINESYFLYNKSDLTKETFVTALKKKKFMDLLAILIKKQAMHCLEL